MTWGDPQEIQQGDRNILTKMLFQAEAPRFALYQTPEIATMWVLYDYRTGAFHYLYGEDWDEAQNKADERIGKLG